VGIVLGEDQRFRHLRTAREDLGEEAAAEGLEHGPDLVVGDDRAIERLGTIGHIFVELLPAAGACLAISEVRPDPRFDGAPALGDLRADPVHVEVDVDCVGDGLLVRVLHDEVLVEEAEGLLVRRRGQPDHERIEVVEHLAPNAVDRAVRLVDDDHVERLGWHGRVVLDGDRSRGFHVVR